MANAGLRVKQTSECTERVFVPGITQAHMETPEKCAMKIKEEEEEEKKKKKKKTTRRLKIILMNGGFYKALSEKWLDGS